MLDPKLVVADEAVSALDVSVQAQTLNLLQDLQDEFRLTCVFIAHDLSVVEHISDRVAVMYVGRIVELAATETLFARPRHSCTEALLSAVPVPDPRLRRSRERIRFAGEVVDPAQSPPGCHFHPRCRCAATRCWRRPYGSPSLRRDAGPAPRGGVRHLAHGPAGVNSAWVQLSARDPGAPKPFDPYAPAVTLSP